MKMTASRHLSVPFVAILFLVIAAASITACLAGSNTGNAAGVEQRSSSLQKNLKIEVFHSLEGHYFWCVRSFEALLVV